MNAKTMGWLIFLTGCQQMRGTWAGEGKYRDQYGQLKDVAVSVSLDERSCGHWIGNATINTDEVEFSTSDEPGNAVAWGPPTATRWIAGGGDGLWLFVGTRDGNVMTGEIGVYDLMVLYGREMTWEETLEAMAADFSAELGEAIETAVQHPCQRADDREAAFEEYLSEVYLSNSEIDITLGE